MFDSSVWPARANTVMSSVMKVRPAVSVIIPCRNEAKYIGKCLDSIISSEYPKDRLEVFVVDGMSDDGTKEVVNGYVGTYPFIKLLNNPKKITPCALNLGLRNATGEVIIRIDAHNTYGRRYISKCVEYLIKSGSDNVGGILVTLPGGNTARARAIALALSHPFGVGNSRFRTGLKEPAYVDTVPFGCYRKEVFQKIGFFDEDLIRNQDDEFNLRLIRNGGKIMLVPEIVSYYYARDGMRKLWRMFFQYGYFKPLVALKLKGVLTFRQIVPALFVLTLAGSLFGGLVYRPFMWLFLSVAMLYSVLNLSVASVIARKKGMKLYPWLVASFFVIHFSYGFGYLKGVADFILAKKHLANRIGDIPISR